MRYAGESATNQRAHGHNECPAQGRGSTELVIGLANPVE